MTFAEMQAAVFDDLNYPAQPSPLVITRVRRWLNEGYLHLLRKPGLVNLRQGSLNFDSVADQDVYGLPQAFDKLPDAIVQESNNWRLQYRQRDWFRTVDPGETDAGNPYVWIPAGLTPVLRNPDQTSGSGVWAVSSSASDTTQYAFVQGIRANGDDIEEFSVVLNGTTRAAIGSITDYVTIKSLTLSASCVGTISFYDASSSGNLLARIPIGQTSVQYQGIRLWPTPSAVMTYRVDGQFAIRPLVDDTDVPMLPVSYHDMLPVYARFKEFVKQGDQSKMLVAREEWDRWEGQLNTYVGFPADYVGVPGRLSEGRIGWNDLGGAYPADWFL